MRGGDMSIAATDDQTSPPIFVSREEAARLLGGISVRSVIRLEDAGRLTPVRLNPNSKFSKVMIRRTEIVALGEVENADEEA